MTEDVNPRFVDFDRWSTRDAIEAMYEGQLLALAAIKPSLGIIADSADAAAKRLGDTGRLIYVGAGTSGRIAVQDGTELKPTFSWPQERVVFCIAGGLSALTVSAEGAEDSEANGAAVIENLNTNKSDIVFCVAASGRTPFTLGALRAANTLGALTIAIANNPDTPLLAEANYPILLETGSEPIAGSTRMKAGTAQKAVLNMLSTAIMTRLDRVYKGYMVDMSISNNKLHDRAVKMISAITDCSAQIAEASLEQSGKNIKTAVLIALGESPAASQDILARSGGNLRKALLIQASTSA